jgi:hypothetical protein
MKKLKSHLKEKSEYDQSRRNTKVSLTHLKNAKSLSHVKSTKAFKLPKLRTRDLSLTNLRSSTQISRLASPIYSSNGYYEDIFASRAKSNISYISDTSQVSKSMTSRSMKYQKMISKSFANRKQLGDTLSGFSKRAVSKIQGKMVNLNQKSTDMNMDLKLISGSNFMPYHALKKLQDKRLWPGKKLLLKMNRGEIIYFWCKVEKDNFPVYLKFMDKKIVAETIVSFTRERPKKEHAELITRSNFIEIKYPYQKKPKKYLMPSGMMLKLE